jgi:hypothetical protein
MWDALYFFVTARIYSLFPEILIILFFQTSDNQHLPYVPV